MTSVLYDSIARIAKHEASAQPVVAVGRVVGQFESAGAGTDYAVSVELRDTGLSLPRVPIATGLSGFASLPEVDELVVVLFANADYHAPIVVGRLYNPSIPAPEHAPGEIALHLPAGTTASDAKLNFTIKGDEPNIEMKAAPDVEVSIDGEQIGLAAGGIRLVLTSAGGGSAKLEAGGSVVTIKQDGDISFESPGKLTIKATDIELQGSASVKVKGATVDIN